jgi:LacI family transcriptional regulator
MKNNYSSTTLQSLSEELGISVSTVSRVLNGKAKKFRISQKTEEKVQNTAKKLGYTPNQIARGLRLQKTYTIGYVIPDIANPFFASIAQSIERSARKLKYSVLVSDTEENTEIESQTLKLFSERKVDGLIISPVGQYYEHINDIIKKNVPVVLIDRYFADTKIPFVTSDNYQGAFSAVSHMINNGHEKIACIQGLSNTMPNIERVRGYQEALKKNKLDVIDELIVGDSFGEANGYIETKILLKKKERPTAIFAVSNLISLGALRALNEENLRVPEDMSLISFDDQPYSNFLATPMTSVAQQSSEIGFVATKLLIDIIESKREFEPNGIFLPTKLIIRKSVKNIKQ